MKLKNVIVLTCIFVSLNINAIGKRKAEQTFTPKTGFIIRNIDNRTGRPIWMRIARNEADHLDRENIIVPLGSHLFNIPTFFGLNYRVIFTVKPAEQEDNVFGLQLKALRSVHPALVPDKRAVGVAAGLSTFNFLPIFEETGNIDYKMIFNAMNTNMSDYYVVDLILAGDRFEDSKIVKIIPRIVAE